MSNEGKCEKWNEPRYFSQIENTDWAGPLGCNAADKIACAPDTSG